MKTMALLTVVLLTSANSWGLGAQGWTCYGKDNYYQHGVEFDITYGDAAPGGDYRAKVVQFKDGNQIDLLKKANCKGSPEDGTYVPHTTLTFVEEDDVYDSRGISRVLLFSACDAEVFYDVEAFCKKLY